MRKYFHPDHKNYYATKDGQIYNRKRNKPIKETMVNGCSKFSIYQKRFKPISYPFHKFIWEAIIGEEVGVFYKVIHIDGNKLNNERSNLIHVFKDTKNPMRIKRKIIATNLVTGHVTKYDSIYQASKSLNINPGSIRLIAEGKRKTAKPNNENPSYTFEFVKKIF